MPLDIFDVIELGCKRILDINNEHFPVGLTLIEECHDAKDFDLFDLANVTDLFANFTDVKWIVVAVCLGLCMSLGGILPGL